MCSPLLCKWIIKPSSAPCGDDDGGGWNKYGSYALWALNLMS